MSKIRRQKAIEFLMLNDNSGIEVYHSLSILTYEKEGFYLVAIFEKSFRPKYHYKFQEVESRNVFIEERKISENQRNKEIELTLQKGIETKSKIQVDTIMYSSWGYEQTNIDFYIVVERKNDFVKLQEIGQHKIVTSPMQGTCTPNDKIKIGEPFRKKINKFGSVNLESYKGCWVYEDGKAMSWSSYA